MIAVVTADAIVKNRKASLVDVKQDVQIWDLGAYQRAYGVHRNASISRHEQSQHGTNKGQSAHTNSKTVEYEHGIASNLGGLGGIVNFLRPMKIN